MGATTSLNMGSSEAANLGIVCLFCCSFLGGEIAYLYFGITALIDQYDAASGCGWWLWGTTFAGVAYGPVGMLLSLMSIAYTAMIVHDIKDAPGAAVLASGMCSVCLLGCGMRTASTMTLTWASTPQAFSGHQSHAWGFLVGSLLIWTVALVRKSCGGSSGGGSHMNMV